MRFSLIFLFFISSFVFIFVRVSPAGQPLSSATQMMAGVKLYPWQIEDIRVRMRDALLEADYEMDEKTADTYGKRGNKKRPMENDAFYRVGLYMKDKSVLDLQKVMVEIKRTVEKGKKKGEADFSIFFEKLKFQELFEDTLFGHLQLPDRPKKGLTIKDGPRAGCLMLNGKRRAVLKVKFHTLHT